MPRKTLLNRLKQQVLAVQRELNLVQPNQHAHGQVKQEKSRQNHSRLFTPDHSFLKEDRHTKSKPNVSHCPPFKNIAELISQKSKESEPMKWSQQRKQQYRKTKENFAICPSPKVRNANKSPNPITGEGYKGFKSLSQAAAYNFYSKSTDIQGRMR